MGRDKCNDVIRMVTQMSKIQLIIECALEVDMEPGLNFWSDACEQTWWF